MLGALHVIIRRLQQPKKDILHVIAHIPCFGQRGRVGNGKRHFQNAGQGLGKQRLAAAGRTDHQNIALLQLHIIAAAEIDALVVVINRHRQGDLGAFLANHILIQDFLDFLRRGQLLHRLRKFVVLLAVPFIVQQTHAKLHAFVADIGPGTGDDAFDFIFMLPAKRAANRLFFIIHK